MATLPPFALSGEYFLFILSVTLTTLLVLLAASLLRSARRRTFPTWRKKLLFFPVFIVGIFGVGWATAKLQLVVLEYLKRNVATSVLGIVIAVVVAWMLYDVVLWRRST